MMYNNPKIHLIVVTDFEGAVCSVLRDDHKLIPENIKNLHQIVDGEGYLNLLYSDILSKGSADNSKIKFRNSSLNVQTYGIKLDDQILILCSAEAVNVYDYIDELVKINTIQTNTIRLQSKVLAEKNEKSDIKLIEKLTILNNDLVNIQRDLFKKNDALKRITEKMNTVFKSAGLGFVFLKLNGIIESFNDAGMDFINRLTGENLNTGMNLSECKLRLQTKYMEDLLLRILNENHIVEDIYLDRWYELRSYPVEDEFADRSGILLIAENIDRRKKNEKTIENQKELLYLINKILRHDLANVFTVSLSATSLYKRTLDKTMLDSIVEASNKGIAIIDRMKSAEGILYDRKKLCLISLETSVHDVMKEYKEIHYTCEGIGKIYADNMILSLLNNLVSNAKRHGNASEMQFIIQPIGDEIKFIVSNNGKPIPEKVREKVFEENFTYGKTAHTGIGLYIVKKTTERYNGKVHIETCEGGGPCFIFHFPAPKNNENNN